jgi:hypothetical protein
VRSLLAATRLAAANAACTHAKALRSLHGLMHDGIVEWQAPAIKLDELLAAFLTMPDGQISIWLSSPSRKNILLNPSGKSLI